MTFCDVCHLLQQTLKFCGQEDMNDFCVTQFCTTPPMTRKTLNDYRVCIHIRHMYDNFNNRCSVKDGKNVVVRGK